MLSDLQIRKAKALEKPYKLADGGGLYIEVFPNGSKLWRLKYRRPDKKETRVSLGKYPEVSAPQARAERDKLKLQRKREGIDPATDRRLKKLQAQQAAGDTFEAVAREWHAKQLQRWRPQQGAKVMAWFEKDLFPWIGSRPVSKINSPELLTVIRRIEGRGAIEKSHRVLQVSGQIFRYAVATGRAESEPASALRGSLTPVKTTHHASITEPKAVGELLRAIDRYTGTQTSRCALRLAPLVFVRPGELRHAEWAEINFATAEWRIPAEKMKLDEPHIVPLSTQAIAILEEMRSLTGTTRYIFHSERSIKKPISENAINSALRRLGYTTTQMTGHGFRAMARTILDEVLNERVDLIEHQLAHAVKDTNGRAYNRTAHLPERKRMMQVWADYLDVLKAERKTVVIGAFGKVA